MPINVTMPRLSDTMEQGTVVKWHVKVGDKVASGQVIADIETDKATMEQAVFDEGIIAKLVCPEGKQVKVGDVIAVLAEDGESVSDAASSSGAAPATRGTASAAPAANAAAAPSATSTAARMIVADVHATDVTSGDRMRVSPLARRMASEMGVELSQVQGSGPGGRVVKRDVLLAAENRSAAVPATRGAQTAANELVAATPSMMPAAATSAGALVHGAQSIEVPVSNMRGIIAKRLVESKQQIPHYQVTMKFSMDAVLALRGSLNEQLASMEVKLSVNDFIVRACALAMAKNPFFNASWAGDRILLHQQVNVGVAIALPEEKGGGLVVGVVKDANLKSLRQISGEIRSLGEKARTKGLSMDEMSGATFTISNLGMFGVDNFTAIINPPNSAILACGAALEQPVVRNHQLVVGWEMAATLSLDHRVIDGAMASKYLQSLKQFVEGPTMLLV
ncbi:MAG: pyruvate dehydrogenase complex dihydrolipoamide acetyltransferase [Planctomycetota bacterium]|nr:MAG: pyruvate dehydrogenase complex dihydrolipoamide acetyltransferase [Planctomycetota bacterium]HAQ67930.1 pyruvate dehydrogenase complex dihydrolipoamide acetyltransferase [Phycisphaerales bacterium]